MAQTVDDGQQAASARTRWQRQLQRGVAAGLVRVERLQVPRPGAESMLNSSISRCTPDKPQPRLPPLL
jgi:hypothetical protein